MIEEKLPKIVVIVQARMGSTRLPGKVLLPILDRPMLEFQLERLRRVQNAHQLIVATTSLAEDEPIVSLCKRLGVAVFRGESEDVLKRYYDCARKHKAGIIVRITGDCPLIDPEIVDKVIWFYLTHGFDYAGNTLKKSYPRGMDTEVFSLSALAKTFREAQKPEEREHVTLHMYKNPEKFSAGNTANFRDESQYRLTVDQKEDFQLVSQIIERLYPGNPSFSLRDIIKFLEENPSLATINRHIIQKQS